MPQHVLAAGFANRTGDAKFYALKALRRPAIANWRKACRQSRTQICGSATALSILRDQSRRWRRPPVPAGRNLWPSDAVPGKATNRSPGFTTVTAVNADSGDAGGADVGSDIGGGITVWLAVSWPQQSRQLSRIAVPGSLDSLFLHLHHQMASDRGIVKWQAFIADKLNGLMAFASNQQDIARPNACQRCGDGFVAAGYFNGIWTGGDNCGTDAGGILGAWVIVSDETPDRRRCWQSVPFRRVFRYRGRRHIRT